MRPVRRAVIVAGRFVVSVQASSRNAPAVMTETPLAIAISATMPRYWAWSQANPCAWSNASRSVRNDAVSSSWSACRAAIRRSTAAMCSNRAAMASWWVRHSTSSTVSVTRPIDGPVSRSTICSLIRSNIRRQADSQQEASAGTVDKRGELAYLLLRAAAIWASAAWQLIRVIDADNP